VHRQSGEAQAQDSEGEEDMSAKITLALHEIMGKVGYIQKTGKNQFHGYKYAGEADLLDKLRPAMIEAGLILMPSVKTVDGPDPHGNTTVFVEYVLAHKDGDVWPEKLTAIGCGNDRAKSGAIGDKGVYKAITGANKYLLFKLFQIETGDDPERDEPPSRRHDPQLEELSGNAPVARVVNPSTGRLINPSSSNQQKKPGGSWETLQDSLRKCEDTGELCTWYLGNQADIHLLNPTLKKALAEEWQKGVKEDLAKCETKADVLAWKDLWERDMQSLPSYPQMLATEEYEDRLAYFNIVREPAA
jgi:hypothetical protein